VSCGSFSTRVRVTGVIRVRAWGLRAGRGEEGGVKQADSTLGVRVLLCRDAGRM